jgi:hypothetical protein
MDHDVGVHRCARRGGGAFGDLSYLGPAITPPV